MPTPPRPPGPSLTGDSLELLPLAWAALIESTSPVSRGVVFTPWVPPLPADLAHVLQNTWGVTIEHDESGIDASALPAFSALVSQARSEQILRALSRTTNLTLAGSRSVVVGDGTLATALLRTLNQIGSRATLAGSDPVKRLRAELGGFTTIDARSVEEGAADYILATGEGQQPLQPESFTGVLVDASLGGDGFAPHPIGPAPREHVHRPFDSATWILDVPAPLPSHMTIARGLDWHIADLITALAILLAAVPDPIAADVTLARLALR